MTALIAGGSRSFRSLSPYLGSDQEKTFGPTISGLIHRHIGPERLLLWDSKVRGGRPDTMKLVKDAYYSWGAEGTSSYLVMHSDVVSVPVPD
jgi:hypothetical protein